MSGSSKPRRVMTASQMGASAVPLAPSDPGPALPVPAPPAPVSDIASKQASNNGHNADRPAGSLAFNAADLIRGLPSAEADLVTVTVRIPRVLAEALDIESRVSRRPRQAIVSDALWARANADLVNDIHQRLYGVPRYPQD